MHENMQTLKNNWGKGVKMNHEILTFSEGKAVCGMCGEKRSRKQLIKSALKKKKCRTDNILVVVWRCNSGHTNFTSLPLYKRGKM